MTQQNQKSPAPDLAGEYVLGTLQGERQADFEHRLKEDTALQAEVSAWEQRFAPMLEAIEPVKPPVDVWRNIEQRLDPSSRSEKAGILNSLGFWRNLGMLMASLVMVLTLTLFGIDRTDMEMDRVLVVMNEQSQAGWIIGTAGSGGQLHVKAVAPTRVPKDKVCQLWMETGDGRLVSVGILPERGAERMNVPVSLRSDSRFKISIEPVAELPATKPSGEFVFEGGLTSI
ncbi:MAG: anti-sigma factor [gamma proteobacterium endosymbiont of Lamellibrachia anaximandri]|nr:anti-sigma factor [gamma proteobacterium endosymbiont of Lamellibrachia anaximandri]MBL3533359.1 anti-sigma factor [gamma proteobacterium endosymbiont of Lamellibrachia anaximandri]